MHWSVILILSRNSAGKIHHFKGLFTMAGVNMQASTCTSQLLIDMIDAQPFGKVFVLYLYSVKQKRLKCSLLQYLCQRVHSWFTCTFEYFKSPNFHQQRFAKFDLSCKLRFERNIKKHLWQLAFHIFGSSPYSGLLSPSDHLRKD